MGVFGYEASGRGYLACWVKGRAALKVAIHFAPSFLGGGEVRTLEVVESTREDS